MRMQIKEANEGRQPLEAARLPGLRQEAPRKGRPSQAGISGLRAREHVKIGTCQTQGASAK
ncbi:hypothetical protein GCM10010320_05170 [Streptomyces caelestis]|nr:hypothetical protein GCM10010320_05170 [Streptomyces caelestis]